MAKAKNKDGPIFQTRGFQRWAGQESYYLNGKIIMTFRLGERDRLTHGYRVHFSNVRPITALDEYYQMYGKKPFVSQFDQPPWQSNTSNHTQGSNSWLTYPWKVARAKAMKGRCYLCAEPLEGMLCNMDHVIPKSKGGTDTQNNQLVTHEVCNNLKGNRMPTKRELDCLKKVNAIIAINRAANEKLR